MAITSSVAKTFSDTQLRPFSDLLGQLYYRANGLINFWNANGGAGIANATTVPTMVAASGGSFAAGTYFWKYTWVNAAGETLASTIGTLAGVLLNQKVTVTIPALPAGATSANVYRAAVSGSELLVGSTATTTFVDNGTAAIGGAAPTSNTTGLIPNDSENLQDGAFNGDGRLVVTGIKLNNIVVRATDIKNLMEGSVAVSTNDASKAVLNTVLQVAVNPGS